METQEKVVNDAEVNATPSQDDGVKQGVESPTISENDVNNEVDTSQLPEPDVDEKGVPFKNRYIETKRKLEKQNAELEEVKKVLQGIQQHVQPKEREYTLEDLSAFAKQHPEHADYAEKLKLELIQKQAVQKVREEFQTLEQQKQAETVKQQSLRYVAETFPDAFTKDGSGRAQWNPNSPLTKEIARLKQDERLSSQPDGLAVAAEIAHSRLVRQQVPVVQNTVKQKDEQIKELQKRTLVEGSGKNFQDTSPIRSAVEEARSGRMQDASGAMKEILRAKGFIQ